MDPLSKSMYHLSGYKYKIHNTVIEIGWHLSRWFRYGFLAITKLLRNVINNMILLMDMSALMFIRHALLILLSQKQLISAILISQYDYQYTSISLSRVSMCVTENNVCIIFVCIP